MIYISEFTVPGTYTVITKFSNLENDRFPRITLRVLSTLEVICLRSQMKDQDKGPILAAALAYLIQCDMAGEHDTPEQLVDDALLNVLQSVSKVPLLSLPAFLCGKKHTTTRYDIGVWNTQQLFLSAHR